MVLIHVNVTQFKKIFPLTCISTESEVGFYLIIPVLNERRTFFRPLLYTLLVLVPVVVTSCH